MATNHPRSGGSGTPMVSLTNEAWSSGLVEDIYTLWKENILVDTQIKCLNNDTVNAHSLILASCSPFLKGFFSKARQGLYTLKMDTTPATTWHHLLDFLYTGRLQVPVSQFMTLYNTVKKLQIHAAEALCETYIQSTLEESSTATGATGEGYRPNTPPTSKNSGNNTTTRNGSNNSNNSNSGIDGTIVPTSPTDPVPSTSASEDSLLDIKMEPRESAGTAGRVVGKLSAMPSSQLSQSGNATSGGSSTPESGVYQDTGGGVAGAFAAPPEWGDKCLQIWNVCSLQPPDDGVRTSIEEGEEASEDIGSLKQKLPEKAPIKSELMKQYNKADAANEQNEDTRNKSKEESHVEPVDPNNDTRCSNCDRVFVSKHGLKLHKNKCDLFRYQRAKQYVTTKKAMRCKMCGEIYKSYAQMLAHLELAHPGQDDNDNEAEDSETSNTFMCNVCLTPFTEDEQLQRHMTDVHPNMDSGDTQAQSTPSRTTSTRSRGRPKSSIKETKKSDVQKKQAQKSAQAQAASPSTKKKAQPNVIDTDTDDMDTSVSCRHCQMSFSSQQERMSHEKTQHKEKANLHLCTTCGLRLNSLVEYRRHMDTHMEQEQRTCKVCAQVFRSAKALYSHMRVHKTRPKPADSPQPPTEHSSAAATPTPSNSSSPSSPALIAPEGVEVNDDEAPDRHIMDDEEATEEDEEEMDVEDGDENEDLQDEQDEQDMEGEDENVQEVIAASPVPLDLTNKGLVPRPGSGTSSTSTRKLHDPYMFHSGDSDSSSPSGSSNKKSASTRKQDAEDKALTRSLSNKKPPFKCYLCGKVFKKQGMLEIHIAVHRGQSNHECHLCHRQFAHSGALKKHMGCCLSLRKTENGQNGDKSSSSSPAYVMTPTTPSNISGIDQLDGGVLDMSTTYTSYDLNKSVNTNISADFSSSASVIQGNSLDPVDLTATKTYSCQFCHKICVDRRQLYRHECVDADGNLVVREYTCKLCSAAFEKSMDYKLHMKNHHGAKRIMSIPPVRGSQKAKRVRKTVLFECLECGKNFLNKNARQTHMYQSHPEALKRVIHCQKCPETFKHDIMLAQHMYDRHDGMKPHLCPFCGERFGNKGALKVHHNQAHDSLPPGALEPYVESPLIQSLNTPPQLQRPPPQRPQPQCPQPKNEQLSREQPSIVLVNRTLEQVNLSVSDANGTPAIGNQESLSKPATTTANQIAPPKSPERQNQAPLQSILVKGGKIILQSPAKPKQTSPQSPAKQNQAAAQSPAKQNTAAAPSLKKHSIVTLKFTPSAFSCKVCQAGEFRTDQQLQDHMLSAHGNAKDAKIALMTPQVSLVDCSKAEEGDSDDTSNSEKDPSSQDPVFECTLCDSKLNKKKFVAHMYKHATVRPSFECESCKKNFLNRQSFLDHFCGPRRVECKDFYIALGQAPWVTVGSQSTGVIGAHPATGVHQVTREGNQPEQKKTLATGKATYKSGSDLKGNQN